MAFGKLLKVLSYRRIDLVEKHQGGELAPPQGLIGALARTGFDAMKTYQTQHCY
jgi:hypothetical protein